MPIRINIKKVINTFVMTSCIYIILNYHFKAFRDYRTISFGGPLSLIPPIELESAPRSQQRNVTIVKPPKISKEKRIIASKEFRVDAVTKRKVSELDLMGYKKILFWNDYDGRRDFKFGYGAHSFELHGCSVTDCYATSDRDLFKQHELDAVVWNLRGKDKSLPETRSRDTMFVFWMMESVYYSYDSLVRYNNLFNWTITYRPDSDFFLPYGEIQKMSELAVLPQLANHNYAKEKTKMAAWFVSFCQTSGGRELIGEQLQKYMEVDVFGGCGPLKCIRGEFPKCNAMLEKDYKFYLSFENSLCKNYVTEVLYRVLELDVVPVVYGLGYDALQLPPHSYINALNFSSVQQLADYMLFLDGNDEAYNEYFKWKSKYLVKDIKGPQKQAICDLCERLHQVKPLSSPEQNTTQEPYTKAYGDMKTWLTGQQCITKHNTKIKKFISG